MSRFTIAFGSVVVVAFSQVSVASTPVSFFVECPDDARCTISDVGSDGLVITDVIGYAASIFFVELFQQVDQTDTMKARLYFGTGSGVLLFHYDLTNGVVFAPESVVSLQNNSGSTQGMTLTGYIPTPTGTIPAVGTVGLVIMVVLVLGAGAIVLSRRKQVAL